VVLSVTDAVKHFPITQGIVRQKVIGQVRAGRRCLLRPARGETLGLVGESGCGKSTLSRVLMGLLPATSGRSLLGQ
jgi:ABC-type glutathione transport system ATPase component